MHFTEWYEGVIEKVGERRPLELWLKAVWFAFAVLLFCLAYLMLEHGEISVGVWSKAFASAAVVLIGCSFALSGLCYFWNFVDTKIIYRKYIGLMGFYLAVVHAGFSIALLRQFTDFWTYYGVPANAVSNGMAVLALLIFLMMAAISNQFAVHELGTTRWRQLLRVGYLGYVFAMIHFGVKRWDEWGVWVSDSSGLPPISLLLIIFAVFVIFLRGALWVSLKNKA